MLIVGLGNPGKEYEHTRHNAGAWFIEKLAADYNVTLKEDKKFHGLYNTIIVDNHKCHLLIPTTYMNNSGRAVFAVSDFYKIPDNQILVVHDELDLEPGIAQLKIGGGNAGHNGLKDISLVIKTNYLRLRIGIGRPPEKGIEHVLGKPSKADRDLIDEVINRSIDLLPLILKGQLSLAMNQLHTKKESQHGI